MAFPVSKSAATYCFPRYGRPSRPRADNLSLVAEFPDRETVVLSGIAEVEPALALTDGSTPDAR
jgi:hypothetical protein